MPPVPPCEILMLNYYKCAAGADDHQWLRPYRWRWRTLIHSGLSLGSVDSASAFPGCHYSVATLVCAQVCEAFICDDTFAGSFEVRPPNSSQRMI